MTSLSSDGDRPIALITGCSSGIGEASAIRFSQEGYRVYATMRDPGGISGKLKQALQEEGGHRVLALDVADGVAVKMAVTEVEKESGRIDVLVNNAGISSISSIEEIAMEEAKAIFETNVFGVLRMTQEVLGGMRNRRSGTIVNVSSVAGRIVSAGHGIYAASKHALEAMSESLAGETNQFGIRVILMEPGFISTPILKKADSIILGDTPYKECLGQLINLYREAQLTADSPDTVARSILNALNDSCPRLRYVVGSGAQSALNERNLLTDQEWISKNPLE